MAPALTAFPRFTLPAQVAQQMPSFSAPGVTYRVTLDPDSCACEGFAIWRKTCRHLKAARAQAAAKTRRLVAASRRCEWCRIDVARQCSPFCSPRCQQAAATEALMAMPVDLADAVIEGELVEDEAPEWSFVHCVRCSLQYAFDEAHPLLCPACRLADVPAVSGIALVEVRDSSPEEIAATRELMRETTWTLIAGVAPAFAGIA